MRLALALCTTLLLTSCDAVGTDPEGTASTAGLSAEEREAGFVSLFDGATLSGWRGYGRQDEPEGWGVEDGLLVRHGPGGDLVTEETYGDFELRLEWRISEGGNSGIFFHVQEGHDAVWRTGPEMQVLDNARHPDGRSPLTSAGANYALHAPSEDVTRPVGAFNEVRLRVQDRHVEHWLNGTMVLCYDLGSPEWEALVAASKFAEMPDYGRAGAGHIALQDHGDLVAYRRLRIRRL